MPSSTDRPWRRGGGTLAAAVLCAACSLDTTGQGSGSGMLPAGSSSGTTSSTSADTSGGPGVGTGDGGSTGGSTTTGGDTTGPGPASTTTTDDTTGPCVEQPWFPDDDLDGYGDPSGELMACAPPPGHVGMGGDCDDGNGAINPGADEQCNGIDDDCDEIIDEGSAANGSCNGCTFVLANDGSRYFAVCGGATTWDQALASCIASFGPAAQLARIDNDTDQNALLGLIAGVDHWLSLNDLVEEGLWRWHDDSVAYMNGAPVGYNGWRPDQPVFGDADCGELDAGGWADAGCGQNQPRICEHPP